MSYMRDSDSGAEVIDISSRDGADLILGPNVPRVLGNGGVLLGVHQGNLPYMQEMVRQQILGDRETLRDIECGREVTETRQAVARRLSYLQTLAKLLDVNVGEAA